MRMKHKLNFLEYILHFVRIKIVSTYSFFSIYSTYEIIVVDTQVRENMLMFGNNKSEYILRYSGICSSYVESG
jgi:hypothetical protein